MLPDLMTQPTERLRSSKASDRVAPDSKSYNALVDFTKKVAERVEKARDKAREECHKVLDTDSMPVPVPPVWSTPKALAEQILRHYYTWYELYDCMIYPLAYGSEVGEEIAPVEPVRVSPLRTNPDTRLPEPNDKLAPSGIQLGHFGAFLDEGWRGRDILIGRLNAAEKLIATVLAGTPHDRKEFVAEYVRRAQGAIVEEEFARTDSFVEQRLRPLAKLDTADKRLDYVLSGGLAPDPLARDKMVDWTARSAQVLGRVLDGAAAEDESKKAMARWVTRAGQLVAVLGEITFPRRLWASPVRTAGVLLFVFAVVLLVIGGVRGESVLLALGGQLLVLAAAIALAAYALRLWLVRKELRIKIALVVLAAVPLVVGVRDVWRMLMDLWIAIALRLGF